jgi:glutamyl-tRNA synthetase
LYNLLFARKEKGTFILRIEDTDVERSREELSAQILSAMEWLSLDFDEGPYYQSQRHDLYRAAADRLIADGKAYRAFETPEELDAARKKAEAEKRSYRYSGAGREILPQESERRARAGERHVVRLRMPAETIVVDDMIRGRIEFPADALDDFVLVRSDGHPLYHFGVCVDDVDMRITHVLRGDDHLANTPKHVALFRALGAPVPRFAHLGMILGTDRKKLSKRHGAAAGGTRASFPRRSSTSSRCSAGPPARTARSCRARRWSASSRSSASALRRPSSIPRSSSG